MNSENEDQLERTPTFEYKPLLEALDEWKALAEEFEKHFPEWRVYSYNPGFGITRKEGYGSMSLPSDFVIDLLEKLKS